MENDVCKNCPVGMKPTIDRRKCINNTMSANVCTIDGYAYNKDQNDCVKGWHFPPLRNTYKL